MKSYKLLLLSSALALSVSAFESDEAFAFGDLIVDVDKEKLIDVELDIDKDKDVDIDVDADLDLDGAAEVDSVVNQEIFDNDLTSQGTAIPGLTFNGGAGVQLQARINNALNDNTGVIQVNQDVGYMSNQGNVAAVAVVNAVDNTFRDLAEAQESAEQANDFNSVIFQGGLGVENPADPNTAITRPDREARITNAINFNQGIVHVNQNAGAMNNQLNDVAVAVADESAVVALAEADLGQFNTNNTVDEVNTVKRDLIRNAINDNDGIVNVNQSTGNMNNQGTIISFAGLATIN